MKQYGSWESAKVILNSLPEPLWHDDNCEVSRPHINGYPVNYVKNTTSKGIKSFLVIMNPVTSDCYIKNFQ